MRLDPKARAPQHRLDAGAIRDVLDGDCGKIRLAGYRADTGKLRKYEFDLVIALGLGVSKCFQDRAGLLDLRPGYSKQSSALAGFGNPDGRFFGTS